jgi:transposase
MSSYDGGMDEPGCPDCRELRKRVAELEAQLQEALRAGKRQAAPFRKGPPKADPKTPGRKAGDAHGTHGHRPPPPPDQIAECHEAHLPDDCPHCHGPLVETEIVEQFQTDIPRKPVIRKFNIHVGHCSGCGKRTQGRHPLQTSDALGAAASQVGPDAQAAATILHTKHGLSHGKVAGVFDALFGIPLTRGASAQINQRAATRLEGDYRTILDDLRRSERIAADETGWRIGGHPAWLHVWVGERSTAYAIDSHRSADALERVIGLNWSGTLSHDGYATYDRFAEAIHQSCVAHVLRRARGLLDGARGGAVRFPRQVIELFTGAVHLRNEHLRGQVALEALQDQRDVFDDRLLEVLRRPRRVPKHATFAKHLWRHFEQWFTFLFNPRVEATNWPAEQAIRPAVVNRKVWGGNRTPAGARAQGVLMSVLETVRRTSQSVVDYVSESLRAFGNRMLTGPVLQLGR